MTCRPFVAVLLLLLPCPAAFAEKGDPPSLEGGVLTISVGNYKVDFRQAAEWTLGNVQYQGKPLVNYTGANQTTINLRQPVQAGPDAWVGSSHGGETIHSVVLKVDGTAHPLDEHLAAPAGSEYCLAKESDIGPYRMIAETTVSAAGVRQVISLGEREPSDEVRYLYVLMHCWNSSLTEWSATLPDGSEIRDTFPLERVNLLKQDIMRLVVYSPQNEIGAVMVYDTPYEGEPGHSNFVACWPDRHNKHYLRLRPDQAAGQSFACSIVGFEAFPDDWTDKAREVASTAADLAR